MKKNRFSLVTLLTLIMVMLMNVNVLAAEPTDRQQPVVAAETTEPLDVEVPEVAPQANDDYGIMPLGIGGYAAKYTDSSSGLFTVDAPGDGSWSGTFQITTHEFSTSPTITAVLYRPDGSLAARILINGNGTKTAKFSNAVPGTYTVVYSVASTYSGWISAWVSS